MLYFIKFHLEIVYHYFYTLEYETKFHLEILIHYFLPIVWASFYYSK